MSLLGKSFVVTGGASGIGLATVKKLLNLSATVHLIDKADKAPSFNEHPGHLHCYLGIDISSRSSTAETFENIARRTPTLTGLVNCAGIMRPTPLSAGSDADFEALWKVNVIGVWNVATEFYRYVAKAPDGPTSRDQVPGTAVIVNISSMMGLRSFPGMAGYVASKHAVIGLSNTMAYEWAAKGIRVNCIAPGSIRTPLSEPFLDPSLPRLAVMKEVLEPAEVADTILYLLSDASSGIVGQVLQVNGGWL